jgi:Late competence development protein ComFB
MIHNLAEEHVRDSYDGVVKSFPNFCGCGICREDVYVYALNRILPRYVRSQQGFAVTEVALERDQERATIDVAVIEGIRRVSATPRCGKAKQAAG